MPDDLSGAAMPEQTITGRLRLRSVEPPLRLLALLGIVSMIAGTLVVVVPAWRNTVAAAGLGAAAPAWVRVVAFSMCGALSATALAAALVRATPGASRVLISRLLLAALPVLAVAMPTLSVLPHPQGPLLAAACLVLGVAAAACSIAAVLPLGGRSRRAGWVFAAGVCAGLPWIVAAGHAAAVGETAEDLLWLSVTLIGSGLALVVALYGLVRAAESRSNRVPALPSGDSPLWAAWVVLGLVVAAYVVRFVWLPQFFAGDGTVWGWTSPETWPHALLVAGVLVAVVLRSESAPVGPRGRIGVFLMLIVAVSLGLTLASLWAGPMVLVDRVSPGAFGTIDGVLAVLGTPVAIPAVVGTLVFLLPPFRRSIGRSVAAVALVHLLPIAISELEDPTLTDPLLERWFAPATMVLAASVAIVTVLLVLKSIRRGPAVSANSLIRLLVIPLVVVHAVVLLPSALEADITPVAVAVGALLALLVFRRPVSTDPWAQGGRALGATTAALFTLAVFTFALPDAAFASQTDPLAIAWLAAPLAAALCLRRRPDADADGSPGTEDAEQPASEGT